MLFELRRLSLVRITSGLKASLAAMRFFLVLLICFYGVIYSSKVVAS
jgi:hypothetical protein